MLFDYLIRVDLWVRNIDDPKFEKEFFELSKFKITVGEGKDFYEKLGGRPENLPVHGIIQCQNNAHGVLMLGIGQIQHRFEKLRHGILLSSGYIFLIMT